MKYRIVIADDQMLTREGLRTILEIEEDMEVVGLAQDGCEACEMTDEHRPDLVLMDIQMPNMDGITAMKRIKQNRPGTRILILTTFMEEEYILDGMANGASGYIMKDMDRNKMITAIRDAMSGQFILPAAVAAKLAGSVSRLTAEYDYWQSLSQAKSELVQLTDREKRIARLLMLGAKNREIAEALQITEGTARNYISILYGKLEVSSRTQAIVRLQALI